MIEYVKDSEGIAQGEIVPSPIVYPGMKPVGDWCFFRAYAGSKLDKWNKTTGPHCLVHKQISEALAVLTVPA